MTRCTCGHTPGVHACAQLVHASCAMCDCKRFVPVLVKPAVYANETAQVLAQILARWG